MRYCRTFGIQEQIFPTTLHSLLHKNFMRILMLASIIAIENKNENVEIKCVANIYHVMKANFVFGP